MRVADVDLLMLPGWTGAGPDHWITRWSARLKTARVVDQDDWMRVDRDRWTARLIDAVAAATRPVVLVAHSCGVATVVHAAPRLVPERVVAAFLVAPPSEPVCAALPDIYPKFTPFPRARLPFPAALVASRTDPHCPFETAADLAEAWGASLIDAGDCGHLNTDSGHGPWPDGVIRLGLFLRTFDLPARH
jgi:predicted alpha/beta hydrolase family esterase